MIEAGTSVRLKDGTQVTVETFWNQGKVRVFKLTNGSTINDLDQLVASGEATVVTLSSKGRAKKFETDYDAAFPKEDKDDDGADLQDS